MKRQCHTTGTINPQTYISKDREYLYILYRSSHRRCSLKKGVLGNFTKFTGKHLYQSHFFNKVASLRPATLLKKRLWHRCFPMNFAKFLKTPFLQNISRRLLLQQTKNTPKFSCLKNIFGKMLKSLIINVDFKS